MPLIPALARQRQADLYEFEASLHYRSPVPAALRQMQSLKKGGYQIINLGPLTGRQFRTTSRGKSSRNCPDFNESCCAGCKEPPSVRGDRCCLARIPAILQMLQARAWETLPGIFHRFAKQEEGGKTSF
ncbi:hypothetical protein STEG23_006031 [Scotinomys teguina]